MFDVEIIAAVIFGFGSLALIGVVAAREIRHRRAMHKNAMDVTNGRRP